jgi:hypothetical protein
MGLSAEISAYPPSRCEGCSPTNRIADKLNGTRRVRRRWPSLEPRPKTTARMLPTPVVAAAAAKGADRLPVNRLSHARLSRPDRPPEGRWRVPGGMGLRPTLPPAPPARNRRLSESQPQWPPLARHPGASAADDGHIVDGCPPRLVAALPAVLLPISSNPAPRPPLPSPPQPGRGNTPRPLG